MIACVAIGIIIGGLATLAFALVAAPKATQAERDYYSGKAE